MYLVVYKDAPLDTLLRPGREDEWPRAALAGQRSKPSAVTEERDAADAAASSDALEELHNPLTGLICPVGPRRRGPRSEHRMRHSCRSPLNCLAGIDPMDPKASPSLSRSGLEPLARGQLIPGKPRTRAHTGPPRRLGARNHRQLVPDNPDRGAAPRSILMGMTAGDNTARIDVADRRSQRETARPAPPDDADLCLGSTLRIARQCPQEVRDRTLCRWRTPQNPLSHNPVPMIGTHVGAAMPHPASRNNDGEVRPR